MIKQLLNFSFVYYFKALSEAHAVFRTPICAFGLLEVCAG